MVYDDMLREQKLTFLNRLVSYNHLKGTATDIFFMFSVGEWNYDSNAKWSRILEIALKKNFNETLGLTFVRIPCHNQ